MASSPTFPPHQKPKQPFQDVLLFDLADGVLSLHRLSLDKHLVHEQGLGMTAAAASVQALGVTSISLPGMRGTGKLAGSPSRSGGSHYKAPSVVDPPSCGTCGEGKYCCNAAFAEKDGLG